MDKNSEIRAKQFDVECSSLFVRLCIRGNGVDPFSAFSQTCVCCVSLSSSPSSSPNAVLPCLQIESPSVRPSDLMIGKSLRGYIFRETRQRRDDVRESLNVEESLVHVSYSSSSLLLLSMASSPASSFFSYRSCRTREGKGMSHTKKCIGRAKVEGNKREIQSRRRGRIQVTDSSFVAAKANSGELALHAIRFPFLAKSMPSSFYSLFLAFLRLFCWGEGKFMYRKSFSPYFPPYSTVHVSL